MRFYSAVGNPPYQQNINGNKLQIHQYFLEYTAYYADYVNIVHPMNWLNTALLNSLKEHFASIERFQDSIAIFDGVEISSGVGLTLIDNTKTYNKTKIIEKDNSVYRDIQGNQNIIDYKLLDLIKPKHSVYERLLPFKAISNSDKTIIKDPKGTVYLKYKEITGRQGKAQWVRVNRADIPDDPIIDRYKVMMSRHGHADVV